MTRPATCPVTCQWCDRPLTARQRAQWLARWTPGRHGPFCGRSCSTQALHAEDPLRAWRAGRASWRARERRAQSDKHRVLQSCTLPHGPERDAYIYRAGYHAGQELRHRADRARVRHRALR